jgi:bifunctional non-homologous end joining protein LigD
MLYGDACIWRRAWFEAQCLLERTMDSSIEVQGKQLKLSNLEKVLYPATGFTKQQVIDYYVRIAPAMLPHLAGRRAHAQALSQWRRRRIFLRKERAPAPAGLGEDRAHLERRNHRTVHYILADDLPTLVWLANLAAIELHPSLALAKDITCPTMMVFDLDPGPPANIVQCCQVGCGCGKFSSTSSCRVFRRLRDPKDCRYTFRSTLLPSTNRPRLCSCAGAVARARASGDGCVRHEEAGSNRQSFRRLESERRTQNHGGRVFAAAREHPTVSTPVSWEEVERALKKKDANLLVFEARQAVARVEKMGDLFAPAKRIEAALAGSQVELSLQLRRKQKRRSRPLLRRKKPTAASPSRCRKKAVKSEPARKSRRKV